MSYKKLTSNAKSDIVNNDGYCGILDYEKLKTRSEKEIERLTNILYHLKEIFESRKNDLQEFVNSADYEQINKIETYEPYINLKNISQEIKEVEIKIQYLKIIL